jgi:hypothetical protein
MTKDELILNISDALNESKFWFKLEDKVGEIDFTFLEEFAHDLEELISYDKTRSHSDFGLNQKLYVL